MLRFIIGIFIVLHGLVHLLYFGHARRLFELQPGMTWPDGSWAFARLLGANSTRGLAGVACVVAAIGLAVGGVAILLRQSWWRPAVVGAAAFSAVLYLLLWDGTLHRVDNQGAIAILINVVILVAVLVLRWPDLGL